MANLRSIAKKIKSSPKALKETKKVVQKRFEQEKDILLQNFELHPVTQEILGGSNAPNISNTLIGYGNLFSFIGFNEGDDPINPIRSLLRKMNKISSIRKSSSNKAEFKIKVDIVDVDTFREVSPLPWEGGRSWVEGIERGISGFGYYLNSNRNSSRSGKGIQIENKLRVMAFKNTKYMSEIIRNFTKRLRNLK
tara:strand:+ start:2129 stop:2710 length:582 start_codon:yes stop_codon:yes gene_type:complete